MYITIFQESSHLFFISIELKETSIDNDHESMKKVLNWRRPMIVQLSSSSSRDFKIYFKEDEKDFVEITNTPKITHEEFNEAVRSEGNPYQKAPAILDRDICATSDKDHRKKYIVNFHHKFWSPTQPCATNCCRRNLTQGISNLNSIFITMRLPWLKLSFEQIAWKHWIWINETLC